MYYVKKSAHLKNNNSVNVLIIEAYFKIKKTAYFILNTFFRKKHDIDLSEILMKFIFLN